MMNVDTMKICMEKNFFSMIENKQEKRQHFFLLIFFGGLDSRNDKRVISAASKQEFFFTKFQQLEEMLFTKVLAIAAFTSLSFTAPTDYHHH